MGDWNDTDPEHASEPRDPDQHAEDNRIRALVGGFWEEFIIKDQMNFNYLPPPQCTPANLAISEAGGPDCLSAVGPVPGNYAKDPSIREDSNTAFGEDVQRGYRQTAFFTSVDFDVIPKVLTLTGGTRYYHYDEFEQGSEFYSESSSPLILNHAQWRLHRRRGLRLRHQPEQDGKRFQEPRQHHLAHHAGYHGVLHLLARFPSGRLQPHGSVAQRDSGSHRRRPRTVAGDNTTKQYYKPAGYDSDNLVNNEIGLKTEFLDHRVQINASAYRMNWSNVQLPLFDPVHLGNTTFNINGPSYTVKGVRAAGALRA